MRCTSIVFMARVNCPVVFSIVFLANLVRRDERCRSSRFSSVGHNYQVKICLII